MHSALVRSSGVHRTATGRSAVDALAFERRLEARDAPGGVGHDGVDLALVRIGHVRQREVVVLTLRVQVVDDCDVGRSRRESQRAFRSPARSPCACSSRGVLSETELSLSHEGAFTHTRTLTPTSMPARTHPW